MTDTTFDGWEAGYDFDADDVVTPAAVTPPVTRSVTSPVTPAVTPGGTPGVTRGHGWPVTPDAGWPVTPDERGYEEPLDVGEWDEVPDDAGPGQPGGLADAVARLSALTKGSPLLGGNALAAELADPHPGTWREHWEHVTGHENRPAGPLAAAGFVAAHLAVTGPLKFTGKVMTVTGDALSWTGKRTDRASDYFLSAVIFIVLATAVLCIVIIGIGQALSYL